MVVSSFVVAEALPIILLMVAAALYVWRHLSYVRHIRRVAAIEHRIALERRVARRAKR